MIESQKAPPISRRSLALVPTYPPRILATVQQCYTSKDLLKVIADYCARRNIEADDKSSTTTAQHWLPLSD